MIGETGAPLLGDRDVPAQTPPQAHAGAFSGMPVSSLGRWACTWCRGGFGNPKPQLAAATARDAIAITAAVTATLHDAAKATTAAFVLQTIKSRSCSEPAEPEPQPPYSPDPSSGHQGSRFDGQVISNPPFASLQSA